MSTVKLSPEQWSRVLQFLRSCSDVYVGQEAECRRFVEGVLWLTTSVAELVGIGPGTRLLDVGSGRGVSVVHLAKTLGCNVVAVTLEEDGAASGRELANRENVRHLVTLLRGRTNVLAEWSLLATAFNLKSLHSVGRSNLPSKLPDMYVRWGGQAT